MTDENPIQAAIKWLIEKGFDEKQAENICRSIKAKSPEQLWEDAPAWIEWCGHIKQTYECIVMLAATGMLEVELGPKGITYGEEDILIGLKSDKPNLH